MKGWAEDLLTLTNAADAKDEHEVFRRIEAAARALGFDYCAYGLRLPLPMTNPKTVMVNNYATDWRARYAEAGYLAIDPTVLHGRRTSIPLIWSDAVFAKTPQLWDEAKERGLCVGWAQSSLDGYGVGGMLTLARASEPLTSAELDEKDIKMQWLVNIAHLSMKRVLSRDLFDTMTEQLTQRETEVLKWHADGKTAPEIGEILHVSVHTVKAHTKHAVTKLGAANKTAAVLRAAMMGLLN